MTFSFDKEFSAAQYISLENGFILEYLPQASGDAVKVYLYGLYLCANPQQNSDLKDIASALSLSEETVMDCFTFWEEFGLVTVLSKEPLSVKYLPVRAAAYTKPRKYKAEKYTDFTKGVQALLPDRMISTGEYTEYFNIIEVYGIKPEAMLMIIKYCTDKKGGDVSYRYVAKVAKDFGTRGITTVEKVEKELSSYILRTSEIEKILSALSVKRAPDIEDLNYYKKWTNELSFDSENVVFAAKTLKKGSMAKLDSFLNELYSMKCFSKEEIEAYVAKKQSVYNLALKINKSLSVYIDVIETEIENYISKWLSYGFGEDALLYVASRCFLSGNNNLQYMDSLIEELRLKGFIDLSAVGDYFEMTKRTDEFISKILVTCGLTRRPTPWDRENLSIWRGWNFSDDMILEAAKIASGKTSPVAYINGVLSNWKNKGVFTLSALAEQPAAEKGRSDEMTPEDYNREYEKRRAVALARAQKNVEKAMSLNGFAEVYERLFSIEKDLAFAEISGNAEALSALEKEKKDINRRAEKMLAEAGLTLSDLSPRYACEKCNDTGYVGTHRCDCL